MICTSAAPLVALTFPAENVAMGLAVSSSHHDSISHPSLLLSASANSTATNSCAEALTSTRARRFSSSIRSTRREFLTNDIVVPTHSLSPAKLLRRLLQLTLNHADRLSAAKPVHLVLQRVYRRAVGSFNEIAVGVPVVPIEQPQLGLGGPHAARRLRVADRHVNLEHLVVIRLPVRNPALEALKHT